LNEKEKKRSQTPSEAEVDLLLDTHLLLWAAAEPHRLSEEAAALISDSGNRLYFRAVSIWEIVIKSGLNRDDFSVDPHILRRGLMEHGYRELPISVSHVLAIAHLPPVHRDPVDRVLVAQAASEGLRLLTSDEVVASYPGPIRRV